MLLPGRAKLAISPVVTGSPPATITMGIVVIAFLAAGSSREPATTSTSTFSRTSSAMSSGARSRRPSHERHSTMTVSPLHVAERVQSLTEGQAMSRVPGIKEPDPWDMSRLLRLRADWRHEDAQGKEHDA